MHRIRSLRLRIAFAYIAGALLVAGSVAVGTWYITQGVLSRQSVQAAQEQSYAAVEFIGDQIVEGERSIVDLLQILQGRGFDVVATVAGEPPRSNSIGVSETTIPESLRDGVEDGGVGHAVLQGPDHRSLAFGTVVPVTELPEYKDTQVYFFYSLEADDRTLGLLRFVLIAVVAVAAVIAAAVGLRLADRTIRPLRAAAEAARSVAQGELETRIEERGEDELSQLATSFNRMTEALSARIDRERRFVADVSHELRTPLTTLKTSIDYLADRVSDLPPRIASAIGLAAEEVRSLQRLVDDLLELSRAEAGGVEVSRDEVDLVNFASELVRRRAPDDDVRIEGPDRLVVATDKMRLERVVGNLLENAVFHAGSSGVCITVDQIDGHARITVSDSGPGIPEDQLEHIFDRFWRGDASRRRDGRIGAGLGLAIVRENASLIGAELDVESVVGRGTRFDVVLGMDE